MDSSNSINFCAPEFSKVFKRIAEKQNKEGYHCIRTLNRFHSQQFEELIISAKVQIQNLRSLKDSKFVQQIRFLTVYIPNDLEDLGKLCFISPSFLKNIQKVDVIFTEGQFVGKIMIISRPLIFCKVNFIHNVEKGKENYQGNSADYIMIFSKKHDVQITDSNFQGIGLHIQKANKLTLENNTFKNISKYWGLFCDRIQSTIKINNLNIFNCTKGIQIFDSMNKVSINKLCVENCETDGCFFYFLEELNLNDAEIFGSEIGIRFEHAKANLRNCNIISIKAGVSLLYSDARYQQVAIKQLDEIFPQFTKILLHGGSTFTEIM